MKRNSISSAVLLCSAALALSGCAAALVGGAAAGTNSILDRRTTGTQADDQVLELRIKSAANTYLEQSTVEGSTYTPSLSVVSYNRHVLLLGRVALSTDRKTIEEVARAEQDVAAVYNHITVTPTNRTFSTAAADTWRTTKVRTSLLGIYGVYPGRIKIVNYDGTTYVMGLLTPAEQAAVTQKVRTTSGVQRVVTLYQNYTPTN